MTRARDPFDDQAGLAAIRSQFPALRREVGGRPVAYFDGPGGTQVPTSIVQAMTDYLLHHNANTHWAFPTSEETDAALSAARQALADLLNARPGEVVFGPNMTSLTFHVGRALGPSFAPGDEIVVTELDHHANSDPWRHLAKERGLVVRTVRMIPETGELDWEDLEKLVAARTKLVAIGAASNALGTVSDVRRAVELGRAVGAIVFVDAVHYAPHELVDVAAIGCDFLACSAYKFYGPHLGVLWGREDRLRVVEAPKLRPAPDGVPERLETGTQNHEGIVGAAAAVDFLASLAGADGCGTRRERLDRAYQMLHDRGQVLVQTLWDGLHAIAGVRLHGPPPGRPRTPTVSFRVEGVPAREVAVRLAHEGVFVSHGDFYATTVVERLGGGPDGLVRAGCACYTTREEVERLVDGVRRIATG